LNGHKTRKNSKNESLLQLWQILLADNASPAKRRLWRGFSQTALDYMKRMENLPIILKTSVHLAFPSRHRALLAGELTEAYPEFPIWLKKSWGITIVLNIPSGKSYNEEKERLKASLRCGYDIVLIADDADKAFAGRAECFARENGFSVIIIEQDPAHGIYLMRRSMRSCVNNYMSVVLGERPLSEASAEL